MMEKKLETITMGYTAFRFFLGSDWDLGFRV